MKTRETDILILPGLGGSGPDHWQTRWQAKLPTARRVEQRDWDRPDKADWTARIAESIAESQRPVVLVAHSLGVIAAAHVLAVAGAGPVAGAFFVAPPSATSVSAIPEVDPMFTPFPLGPLPCPVIVVGSTNDPYASPAATAELADNWNGRLLDAGNAGHINPASGHGPWPEGLMAFAGFISKL